MQKRLIFLGCLLWSAFNGTAGRADDNVSDVSFRNDVMAVLSKAGCNAGACHGNANGKASFKLSLRGENPGLDYLALTHDQFNRRVNWIEPEKSLILLKPTTQLAHEGGQRFTTNSWEYAALLGWIRAGARDDIATARKLAGLEVSPLEMIVSEPAGEVRISATATFSDGSTRDVTAMAVYEPAHPIVEISPDGLVRRTQFGETTVLVRYLNQQIPVRLAFIPERPEFTWSHPEPVNYIDRHIFAKLKRHRMNPSEVCTDEVFVRRAFLDLLGKLPTAEEARGFVLDTSPAKRARLIDALLDRPEFADYWALKWSDLLRAKERIMDRKGLELFHRWIRQSILDHKPMDQFAREIIAARGSTYKNPPANFYRAARTPVERAEAAAQLFLGRRVQCAQCHNHPFDRWSQDDYYDWQSVFARVDYKILENRRRDSNDSHEFKGEQIVYLGQPTEVTNPRTGEAAVPRFLGEEEPAAGNASGTDELAALAEWMTAPENPFFAPVQANRVWFHLFGRGIVEPLDDFRASNPPSHPELLDELASDFVNHGHDLRQLIRVIMNSRTYQAAAAPNESNAADQINFARSIPRRLPAEVLLDAQSQALAVPVKLSEYPIGTRAIEMAGALSQRRGGGSREVKQFLAIFGKPPRLLPSECERSNEPAMGQAFQLMNGPLLNEMLADGRNRIGQLLSAGRSDAEIVSELYWSALARAPRPPERERLLSHVAGAGPEKRRAALEDVAWAILNSKEFLFR